MRRTFADELYRHMRENKDIILVTGDLGYKVFDQIREEMPKQFINTGAAEQLMVGVGVGLALEGKIPVLYSITPFLLYRPFELIRNYINHEKIPVKLIGSGRDRDYSHDGISHWAEDDKEIMNNFRNIEVRHPESKDEIKHLLNYILYNQKPVYLNLKR